MGLRGTRRAIWKTIRELAAVKAEEEDFLGTGIAESTEVLARIEGWEKKRDGLSKVVGEIEGGGNSERVQGLKSEAVHLQGEIEEMEVRLVQMKRRYRELTDEIAELENNVQAKLSSMER